VKEIVPFYQINAIVFLSSLFLTLLLLSTWRRVSLLAGAWYFDVPHGLVRRMHFSSGWDTEDFNWWDNSVCQHTNYSCSFILDFLCTFA